MSKNQVDTYYLIKGDLSGIQDFIFNVQSDEAAKSLKGRSFFLKILLEVAMRMIFEAFAVEEEEEQKRARVSTSGGNFILRLPVDDPAKVDGIQALLTQALQYTGLRILLAYVEASPSFPDSKEKLNRLIRIRKQQLFLQNFDFFIPFSKDEVSKANSNKGWTDITDQLRMHDCFSIVKLPDSASTAFRIAQKKIYIGGYEVEFGAAGQALDQHLESLFPLYLNKKKEWVTRTFGNLSGARDSKRGINKLGVLAMDVDNLGYAIDSIDKIDAHSAFDERLRTFFNLEIREIINRHFKNQVYTVTAGGDDSFFVGKWNTMLELGICIYDAFNLAFQDMTSQEEKRKKLSISGALVIVDPKFPVIRFAQMAEDALKDAKYDYPESRGNISLFGEILKWEILKKEINPTRSFFVSNEKNGTVTSGLLTKARLTSLKFVNDEGLRLSNYWELRYFLRDYGKSSETIFNKYQNQLDQASKTKDPLLKRNYRLIFPMAARLAEFDKRK